MKESGSGYLPSRVLKLNVGFLLSGNSVQQSSDSRLDLPAVRLSDDLTVNALSGDLRLSRTKEGILVQARLQATVDAECDRCLDPVDHVVSLDVEELYALDPTIETEFFIDEDAQLDLGPLLRAEILIETSHGVLCSPDCKGLCAECGANLNREACRCNLDDIDPRLAALKQLLEPK